MFRQQKKTAADIFDTAELNGARPVEETDINGDLVPSVIQPGTQINYDRILDLWDEYVHSPSMPEREHLLSLPSMEQIREKISWKEPSRFADTEALYGLLCDRLECHAKNRQEHGREEENWVHYSKAKIHRFSCRLAAEIVEQTDSARSIVIDISSS